MADSSAYGGFWIRALAYSADLAILTLGLLVLAVPLVFLGGAGMMIYGLVAAVAPVAYFTWFTASPGQATLGKQLCGLKVQQAATGERISILRSLARELAKFLSAAVFGLGFLIAAFTGRKQGLHDILVSTVVAREGPSRILIALLVAIAGVLIPIVVIPLMFGAMFAALMAMMMGMMMGATMDGGGLKQMKPVPRIEQPVQRPQRTAPAPAPKAVDVPKAEASPPALPAQRPVEAKPAPAVPPKPIVASPEVVRPAPAVPAAAPRTPVRRSAAGNAGAPPEPAARRDAAPCIYKPVMTDEEIARCR